MTLSIQLIFDIAPGSISLKSTVIKSIVPSTGSITPSTHSLNLLGSGKLKTVGSGSTITLSVDDLKISNKTTDYTITAADDIVIGDCAGGNVILTLPPIASKSTVLIFKKSNSNTLTINCHASETIEGQSSITLNKEYEFVQLISDSANTWVNTAIPLATTSVSGLMSSTDKTKLDSVASGATNFTHPTNGANTTITGDTTGKVLSAIAVNSLGHVTSVDSKTLVNTDIPNLDASKITSGVLDAARLPSYVDDVVEFNNLSSFPGTGETGKIYVALDTNKVYRWSGSTYVYITSGAVDSVSGRTGIVTLAKSDVGLANVDNTTDIGKPVSTAQQNALDLKANLDSPSLTGTPLAPTPLSADNSYKIATTEFVKNQSYVTSSGVTSVAGAAPIASSGGNTPTISIAAASQLVAGSMSAVDKTKLDGIASGAQVNVATNLGQGNLTGNNITLTSSTGTSTILSSVTTSIAGLMTATDKTKLDGIASGAQVNVGTNIGFGTLTATTVPLTSSTGSGSTIQPVTTSLAGVMTATDKTKLDGIALGATNFTHPTDGANVTIVGDTTGKVLSAVTVNNLGHVTSISSKTLVASDIPSLDASKITSGVLDAARLPSYVDDVLEFANLAAFPGTGETGKIYVAIDTNKTYRWGGSSYVYITSGAVDSVAGRTGIITLTKSDVGLGNVDNTTDVGKPVSTAQQTALDLKANLDSPNLTGTPSAPTAVTSDNTTKLATTAFVKNQSYVTSSGVTSVTGTSPIVSSGGVTPAISISAATTSDAGSLSASDKTKLDGIASGAQVNVATNLGQGSITATTIPLTSSTGTGTTLPAVTTSLAGLMAAADKTKLDGIETAATGDMTASEILTAIKTVDGTGSGLDADLLDGLSSASFLRSDAMNQTVSMFTGDGAGIAYWNSLANYGTWMSDAANVTWGGRIPGDSTSDYNMYFRMLGGTNRGFVFESSYGSKILSINPTAVISNTNVNVTGKVSATTGFNTGSFDIVYNSTTKSIDFNFLG